MLSANIMLNEESKNGLSSSALQSKGWDTFVRPLT